MRYGLRVNLIILVLLSGCLTQNTQKEQKINLISNQTWTISSKISFSNSEEKGFATLRWRQKKDKHYIDLKFPLNKKIFISGDNKISKISYNDQNHIFETENAAHKLVGLSLPFSNLKWWIKGIQVPNKPTTGLLVGENKLTKEFSQDGWIVQLDDYKNINDQLLPMKISIRGQKNWLILKILSWEF